MLQGKEPLVDEAGTGPHDIGALWRIFTSIRANHHKLLEFQQGMDKEMQTTEFFQQIEHMKLMVRDKTLSFPIFYYDASTLSVQFLASLERVQQILPSSRMHPLRITPWHCVVSISAFEYRDCDIGPYNEVSIGIPVVLDNPSPLFVGTLRQPPMEPKLYIHHLPVTTAIAHEAGVELAGYPKFVADITFERDDKWARCQLQDGGQSILTLSSRASTAESVVPRSRMHPITLREDYMLRSELIVSERSQLSGRGSSGICFELGEHAIAQELKEWKLGQILAWQYVPQHQAILTPVIESFAV